MKGGTKLCHNRARTNLSNRERLETSGCKGDSFDEQEINLETVIGSLIPGEGMHITHLTHDCRRFSCRGLLPHWNTVSSAKIRAR